MIANIEIKYLSELYMWNVELSKINIIEFPRKRFTPVNMSMTVIKLFKIIWQTNVSIYAIPQRNPASIHRNGDLRMFDLSDQF